MDGVVHPNVEQAIGRDRIRKALKRYENRPADEHRYGIVRSVNEDGSYEVLLDGDVQTSRCAQYGTALVGDRVLAVTKKDGRNDLLGRLGGTAVGHFENVTVENELSVSGHIRAGNNIHMENNKYLHGKSADGSSNLVMAGINTSNQMLFGFGSYNNSVGSAYYDGNNVFMRSKGGIYLTSPNAGISGRAYGVNKVLWSGVMYMQAEQTATLSEAVSAQPNGVVLVWSFYSTDTYDYVNSNFMFTFVPKHFAMSHSSNGINCSGLCTDGHMWKYVYIQDTAIKGYKTNDVVNTTGGVTMKSNNYVLRYVLGV